MKILEDRWRAFTTQLGVWTHAVVSSANYIFPKDFLFGAVSSSYQIEGGWNEDGKSNSIWDNIFHVEMKNEQERCWNSDCTNGDVASDSYHNYKRDVEMLKELGVDFYRFSISWPRILPKGFTNHVNQAGVKYYNNLIDELIENGIQPMITLYHWDLPQCLQNLGGWANPLIADWFANYARVVFQLFGDRVKLWVTVNEPMMVCQMGYGDNILAPAVKSYGVGNYICYKNILLAHSRAWHLYNDEFRSSQGGKVGISVSMLWYLPLTDSKDDQDAARDIREFENWPADPIFTAKGDYSEIMKTRIADRSKEQGYRTSRLPEFSKEEIEYVRGSADFFGLNAYATYSVYRNGSLPGYTDHHASDFNILLGKATVPSFADDVNVSITFSSDLKVSGFMTDNPSGFYDLLLYVKERYQNPIIYITENGICTGPGLDDEFRVTYLRGHLRALRQAMSDGVDVRGYGHWSLMDSFEWNSGYTMKFGLYQVDFEDPNRTRIPKKSAKVYTDIIKSKTVSDDQFNKKTEL